jgi:cytoskeletal protein CcmA (bactofilin family)
MLINDMFLPARYSVVVNSFLAFILSFVVAFTLGASPVVASSEKAVTTVVLRQDEVVVKDYFAAGDTVTLSGTVNGDAYVAGGNVIVDGTVNGDLLAAGGNITIRGKVRDDVRVAGGQVMVSGSVGRNITALGGSVTVADTASVSGSLTGAAGSVAVFAPIGREVNIGAGQLTLDTLVNGDVQAGVGQLTLTPNAKVTGDLTYWSEEKAQIAQGAVVTGKSVHNLPPRYDEDKRLDMKKNEEWGGINPVFNLFSFLAALVVGLLITTFMPVQATRTADTLLKKPLLSLGVGVLSMVLAPFLFVLLFVTLIGIPLDLILLAGYLLLIYLAKIFVGIAIGMKSMELINKKIGLGWSLVVGLFIYYVLTMVPVLGFFFWMLAGFAGLGAVLIDRKNTYIEFREKKLI